MYKRFVEESPKAIAYWTLILADILTIISGYFSIGNKIFSKRTYNFQIMIIVFTIFHIIGFIKYRNRRLEDDSYRDRTNDKFFKFHES